MDDSARDANSARRRPAGVAEAESFLGSPVEIVQELQRGDDAHVLRIRSQGRDWALRLSHETRGDDDVEWVSRWVDQVSRTVPQALRRERRGGRSFFRTRTGAVGTILGFVEGDRPARGDPAILVEAATLLARIHRVGLDWSRPAGSRTPRGLRTAPVPEGFVDEPLDAAWTQAADAGMRSGPVHGDYYAGNLLVDHGSVVAILDWDDARVEPILLETAGAIFEFARDHEHRLDEGRARRFLSAYLEAEGPLSTDELRWLGTAMRVWVRRDARVSLAYRPRGGDYVALQARAFHELRGLSLP